METFELAVDALRARQCIKWTRYDADVLPAWVADMDFAVAEPVQAAITRLVECRDYALATRQPFGVWGGLDEEQRRAVWAGHPVPALVT